MHLSEIKLKNFRLFKDETVILLQNGVNVLVGENNSGKTAIIDAIRYTLGTTSYETNPRVDEDDFFNLEREIQITCTFKGINEPHSIIEYLTLDKSTNEYSLIITFKAEINQKEVSERKRIIVNKFYGKELSGQVDGYLRNYIAVTYLKPLRDAERELSAGKGSRLSRILLAHDEFKGKDKDHKLVEVFEKLQKVITCKENGQKYGLTTVQKKVNNDYLKKLIFKQDEDLCGAIDLTDTKLKDILERSKLFFRKSDKDVKNCGLGYENMLFIAAELLLSESDSIPILLIEEPEAHLHPQMQLQLMDFLENDHKNIQTILTTHSPNISSKVPIDQIQYIAKGKAYSLKNSKLDDSDKKFLQKFLDATKANLFFARGVLIVEGDAENLLLPTIAKLLEKPLNEYGISIVNVGHTGLFRYAKIFQQQDGENIPIKVVCIGDKDPVDSNGDSIKKHLKESKGQSNELIENLLNLTPKISNDEYNEYIARYWTLEFDLIVGKSSLNDTYEDSAENNLAKEMHAAIEITGTQKTAKTAFDEFDKQYKSKQIIEIACELYYKILSSKKSKAEIALNLASILGQQKYSKDALQQRLPQYLIDALNKVTAGESE